MQAILKYPLYRRISASNCLEPYGYLPEGSVVEIDKLVVGDKIDGIDTWIKCRDGFHYWEGGIEQPVQQINAANKFSSFYEEYRLEEFWKHGLDGRNVKVGIIDNHFDMGHPALKNLRCVSCTNLGNKDNHYHGAYMASIIGGADYASGIVGVAPGADFSLVGIGAEEDISFDRFQEAVKALGDVDIISMSMTILKNIYANSSSKITFSQIIKEKPTLKLFIAAAGNNRNWEDADNIYPANYAEVLPVAGFSSSDPVIISNSNFLSHRQDTHLVHHYTGFFNKMQPDEFSNIYNVSPDGTSTATAFLCGLLTIIICANKQHKHSITEYEETPPAFFRKVRVNFQSSNKNAEAMVFDKASFFTLIN